MNIYRPIIISGPSGAGKDTLIKKLICRHPEITDAVGYTTRKLRDGEVNGKDITSVNVEYFLKLLHNNELLEYAEFAGSYYGMPYKAVDEAYERLVVFNVGISAAKAIKEYKNDATSILILPPSKEELLRRLGNRGIERYELAKRDLEEARQFFEYVVISNVNSLDTAVSSIESIIFEKCLDNLITNYTSFLKSFFD